MKTTNEVWLFLGWVVWGWLRVKIFHKHHYHPNLPRFFCGNNPTTGSSYGWLVDFSRKNPGCIDFLQSIGGTKQEATALLKDTCQWVRKRHQGKKRRKAWLFVCFTVFFHWENEWLVRFHGVFLFHWLISVFPSTFCWSLAPRIETRLIPERSVTKTKLTSVP